MPSYRVAPITCLDTVNRPSHATCGCEAFGRYSFRRHPPRHWPSIITGMEASVGLDTLKGVTGHRALRRRTHRLIVRLSAVKAPCALIVGISLRFMPNLTALFLSNAQPSSSAWMMLCPRGANADSYSRRLAVSSRTSRPGGSRTARLAPFVSGLPFTPP
jgi:hypothetical protein